MTKLFLKVSLVILLSFSITNTASAMNKAELIDAIASKSGLDKREATRALNAMMSEIMRAVARGEKVTLPEFGIFSPDGTPVRAGRNPQTGKSINIKAKTLPRFTPSKKFKEIVNNR